MSLRLKRSNPDSVQPSKTPLLDFLMLHYDKIVQYNRIMEQADAYPVKRRRRYVVRNPGGSIYRPRKKRSSSGGRSSSASS